MEPCECELRPPFLPSSTTPLPFYRYLSRISMKPGRLLLPPLSYVQRVNYHCSVMLYYHPPLTLTLTNLTLLSSPHHIYVALRTSTWYVLDLVQIQRTTGNASIQGTKHGTTAPPTWLLLQLRSHVSKLIYNIKKVTVRQF